MNLSKFDDQLDSLYHLGGEIIIIIQFTSGHGRLSCRKFGSAYQVHAFTCTTDPQNHMLSLAERHFKHLPMAERKYLAFLYNALYKNMTCMHQTLESRI